MGGSVIEINLEVGAVWSYIFVDFSLY